MDQPETPVAERVARFGPLDASPALRQALDDLAAEDEDLERRLRRVREDRAELDKIAVKQKRKKQRRAMPGGARAPKGPEDDYGESSGDEEEEDPPPPPSSPTERATEALSPSGDGAEDEPAPPPPSPMIEKIDEEMAPAAQPAQNELPAWPPIPSKACGAIKALVAQLGASKVDRVVLFLDIITSGDDPKVDCPVEVAVALDREDRFSSLLNSTVDPSDAAAQKLRELNAPAPKEALSRMLEFISEQAPDGKVLFVGRERLCSDAMPMLVKALRECKLPTTLFKEATYLEVAGMVPGEVVGKEGGLDLSRDELYEALTKKRVPAAASRADGSNFANIVVLACSLEAMGWAFDAVAVGARLADAVPGLLPEQTEASSSEDEAPALSTTRFDGAHWRGRERKRGAGWVYAATAQDLGDAWGISHTSIRQLGGASQQAPSAALAAKYKVEKLQARTNGEWLAKANDAKRDAAFWRRRDGERMMAPGWKTLSRDRHAMCEALKRLYSDQILYAKLGRAPTCEESTNWFKEFITNPPCACNRRANACTTKCTTCGDCVNKNGGGVFEHAEAVFVKASEIPGGVAFLARMRASDASGDAKYLVAWHRPCTQCNKCNRNGLVAFVDRSKLAEVTGAAAREAAADRKADELEALFGYGA